MTTEKLNQNDTHPIYNIKAAAQMTGLLPVTLRAWERRYGLPAPKRGGQGYRLYSEHDVRTLRWLKGQLEQGMSISRAAGLLAELRAGGEDPALEINLKQSIPITTELLKVQLLAALTAFNEPGATEALRRGFALYTVDQVLLEVIEPALVELGEAWHAGELPIVVEHFATQLCVQQLTGMLTAAQAPSRNGTIVAACAPGELHQVGLLMVVAMLRWRGWNVRYLGQNISLERLAEALAPLRPKLLLFSATWAEAAQALEGLAGEIAQFRTPRPKVALGGQGFRSITPERLPGVHLEGKLPEMIEQIERMIQ